MFLATACSFDEENSIEVKLNDKTTMVSQTVINIITKKGQPIVKSDIHLNEKAPYEFDYEGNTYKVFDSHIVYYKIGDKITQYKITEAEFAKIKEL